MSLQVRYQSFLAKPNLSLLTAEASLNYITTLTTVNSNIGIVKHLASQEKALKKEEEKVIGSIEGDSAICLDIETTLEFLRGGGAYLPGLDENFLSDRTVTFPVVHIVHFDHDQKIKQIRLYWDQGSLLKLVDVIGSRANNWPIRDGKDQIRLILSSASATAKSITHANDVGITTKVSSPKKNAVRDPHSRSNLYAPGEYTSSDPSYNDSAVATRDSAKPPPRDYHDLFASADSDASPATQDRAPSPFKGNQSAIAPKGGAGKNFAPSRLFDMDDSRSNGQAGASQDKYINVHPTKFNHFELGDGSDEPAQKPTNPSTRPKSKHQSQWDFADFATPEKLPQKSRGQDKRNFAIGDDGDDQEDIAKKLTGAQPRRDAEKHFTLEDDGGTPAGGRRPTGPGRGQGPNNMSLYQNTIYDNSDPPSPDKKSHPLSTITNLKDRKKDFDSQLDIAESSSKLDEKSENNQNRPIHENRAKAVNMMGKQWDTSDESSDISHLPFDQNNVDEEGMHQFSGSKNKENIGIKLAGDGMGGRKGSEYGSTGDAPVKNNGIKTGGDGMGGRKGAGRGWGWGNEDDEDVKFYAGKKQQGPNASSLWDS